jgi:uncharacterized membrane protein (DUF106 family)
MDYGITGILTLTDAGQSIALISAFLSFVSAMVRRATVDLDKVKDSQAKMKEHQKKMQEAQKKGHTEDMLKSQEEMTRHMMEQMKQNFKPMKITLIPFLLVFQWLRGQYDTAGTVAIIFGMGLGWFWWYFIISLAASMIVNKIAQAS